MKQRLLSFFSLAFLLSASPVISWAQYNSVQDFDGSKQLPCTPTGTGATFTGPCGTAFGTSNTNILPRNTNVYTSGLNSYGVISNSGTGAGLFTTQLDFAPVRFGSSQGSSITFRLAAYSIGQSQGLSTQGSAVFQITTVKTDGSSESNTVATVTSAGRGTYWDFAASGGNITTPLGTPVTRVVAQGDQSSTAAGGNNGGVGTITITLPSGITQADIRIILTANDKSALLVDDVTVTSGSPLPVTLTSFTASRQSSNVYMKWATATEKNNAYFEVQRSNDGKTFAAVGKVTGNGTTATGASYSFTDRNPLAATAYYRLRQVDNDATETYSSVVAVSGTDKIEASFYPNPSNSTVTLPAVNGLVKYRVYTATGQSVAAGEAQGGSEINMQKVPTGIYFLELISADKHNVQRFVKQ